MKVCMELRKSSVDDRREEGPEISVWWDKLSLAQKFSASSLGKFGYELICIRNIVNENIAILQCNGSITTISEDGEIITSPHISLRES